ncbi:hypothetical protein L1887_19689 [Cichorium endivia]|nr:hypothetical protein L1887_19689 [Cichorium endivia]
MGAVTSPPRLCIVTEFLPRGSLFRILQRNTPRLDWKRRLHMAIDIARGMNYLHCCNPPIVHRDLKSSNLLVDKNWTVKTERACWVDLLAFKDPAHFVGLIFLVSRKWDPQNEKRCDVYSYGVVLWEITTERIPWDDLNPMQD